MSSIDILRGAAALAVVFFHDFGGGVSASIHGPKDAHFFAMLPITYGYAGVYLFFVISGFCIHLRWARAFAEGREPQVSFGAFWKRRLRRLYPAYAVALGLGIAFEVRDGASGPWFAFDIGSHVALIHNLHPKSLLSINAVFWTLAIEEQLYLLYFLLLWMRRRYQWRTILAVCLAVRVGWLGMAWVCARYGVSLVVSGSAQATWFIWALGALAVEAFYGIVRLPKWAASIPLAACVFSLTAGLAFLDRLYGITGPIHIASLMLEQPGWALASFLALNATVRREDWLTARRASFAIRALLLLGLVSYSLYLFHMYVFDQLGVLGIPGILLAIVAAAIGYMLFERPFIRRLGAASPDLASTGSRRRRARSLPPASRGTAAE
jgi:peptidoglycan/LPS O-acetylase OafA/YrhL